MLHNETVASYLSVCKEGSRSAVLSLTVKGEPPVSQTVVPSLNPSFPRAKMIKTTQLVSETPTESLFFTTTMRICFLTGDPLLLYPVNISCSL